jgi:DNA adenine methylase
MAACPQGSEVLQPATSILGQPAQRSFLRWAGSKRKLIPRLVEFWNDNHARYVEPFAGSACLFFAIGPDKAVLGDNNGELINVYRVLRDQPERMHRRLIGIPRERHIYYSWRARDPSTLDPETRALRFIYLNHNCFNGIYRTNIAGAFNVPFGSKLATYLSRHEFVSCAEALSNVKLVSGDFQATLTHVKKGDFVYLDPPYAVSSRRMFRQYGKKPFDTDDVQRLGGELRRINKLGAHFVVSYADCREARRLAVEWHSKKVLVRRHIAGFSDHRGHSFEWIIYNRPPRPRH